MKSKDEMNQDLEAAVSELNLEIVKRKNKVYIIKQELIK